MTLRHVFLALVLVLVACKPAAEASASSEADAPDTAAAQASASVSPAASSIGDGAVSAFLRATYGPGASLTGQWSQAPLDATLKGNGVGGDGKVVRQVCAREAGSVAGQPVLLLAVCGQPDEFGHATAGINEVFLLQRQGDALNAAAKSHFEAFGSMGTPGDVEVKRLGADLYGFVVHSGFYNMGQGTGARHILLPRDGAFHEAGWFRSEMENGSWMEGCLEGKTCKPDEAYNVEFSLDIDDNDAAAAAYPLLVHESGTNCGQPANAKYRLVLDPATQTYAVPPALQRDGCTVEPGN